MCAAVSCVVLRVWLLVVETWLRPVGTVGRGDDAAPHELVCGPVHHRRDVWCCDSPP